MSVAFILNPGYNTINNVHHNFWDQEGDAIKNSSLTQALEVSTSVAAPSHVVTGGTDPAQLYMSDLITLSTDAPQFRTVILQAPTAELEQVTELVQDAGITFLNDAHFTSGTGVDEVVRDIDGVGTLTCSILKYTNLDPPITPGDASTWSIYPAIQDVNMALFNISNAGLITCNGIPDSNLSLNVSSQNTDPLHKTTLQLQTNGDGDTIPVIESSISLNSLVTSPSQANNWDQEYGAMVVKSAPSSDIVLSGGRVALTGNNSVNAFVRNSLGAVSFNSDFNTNSPLDYFGTSGQIVQSNGDNLPPSWVDAPTASNWSDYAATSSINTANNSITNASGSEVTISSPNTTIINNGSTELFIKANNDAVSTAVLHFQSGADDEAATSGYIYMNPSSPLSQGSFTNLPNSFSVSSGGTSDLVLSAGGLFPTNCHISYAVNQAYTVNPSGALAFNSSTYGAFALGNFGTTGQVIQSNGSSAPPTWVNGPASGQYVFYVATNGLDANAGDITHPKLTIQSAIDAGIALYPRQVVILIQPGVYSGALSITKPNITLLGYSPNSQQNLLTQIIGNVSIACTETQDLFYSQIGIFNLQISGSITFSSSVNHSFNMENCRISNNGAIFTQTSDRSKDFRIRMRNCTMLQSQVSLITDDMLTFTAGQILLDQLNITARNVCSLVNFTGSSRLDVCALCRFESNTSSASAPALIRITVVDPTVLSRFSFGYNSFVYTSTTSKSNSPAILCSPTLVGVVSGNPVVLISNNLFALAGTVAGQFVLTDANKNLPASLSIIYFFSNCSTLGGAAGVTPQASGIDSNYKTTLTAVA